MTPDVPPSGVCLNSDRPVPRGRHQPHWATWTTHHDLPTGRLVLRADSPYGRAEWSQQWPEVNVGDLSQRLKRIVKALEAAAPGSGLL